jgi:hemerythrin-like domain-containing protein
VPEGSDGALRGWYDIHEALRTEVTRLRDHADLMADRDPESAHAFDERFEFLRAVLTAHSAAEDGIIFAALRLWGIDVPAEQLLEDHQRELGNIYDVHRLLVEARFLGDEEPSTEPLSRVRDAARRLHDDLVEHLAYEEEHVIPMVLDRVSPDDQVRLLGKVVAENPPDLVPRLVPWMAAAIASDHRVALVEDWQRSLPAERSEQLIGYLRDGLPPDMWSELTARVAL